MAAIVVAGLFLLVGVAGFIPGFALARTVSGATAFLIGGGAVYLVLWLYGLVIDHDSAANFGERRADAASSATPTRCVVSGEPTRVHPRARRTGDASPDPDATRTPGS
jgi:hypothetical protein